MPAIKTYEALEALARDRAASGTASFEQHVSALLDENHEAYDDYVQRQANAVAAATQAKRIAPSATASIAKLEAEAAALAIKDRSLTKEQHFVHLLKLNPQAYNDSLRRQSFRSSEEPEEASDSEELSAFVRSCDDILGIQLTARQLADEIEASPNAAVIKGIVEQASEYVSAVQGHLASA